MPNSAACLMQFTVSPPPLARPITFAPDAFACTMNAEKSVVPGNGASAWPSTLPPAAVTKPAASCSSEWPNA